MFSHLLTHQSHYLFGCHARSINSSLIFFKYLTFFKFSMLDNKAVLNREKTKTNILDKKAFLIVVKITAS